MAALTVRNLPPEVHRALKARAAAHGRSTEAEVRAILAASVAGQSRLRIGSALATLGAAHEDPGIDISRDGAPIDPADFA